MVTESVYAKPATTTLPSHWQEDAVSAVQAHSMYANKPPQSYIVSAIPTESVFYTQREL